MSSKLIWSEICADAAWNDGATVVAVMVSPSAIALVTGATGSTSLVP